jgi:hypothetical protein
MNDPRVDVWQSGKATARLQAASTSGKPVLLRLDEQATGPAARRSRRSASAPTSTASCSGSSASCRPCSLEATPRTGRSRRQ